MAPGDVFTTFQFPGNLPMYQISKCYITLGWKVLSGANTLAFLGQFVGNKENKVL